MARSKFIWTGLREYMQELERLPQDCLREVENAIAGEVNGAYVKISAVYGAHRVSGRLQKRLTIRPVKMGELVAGTELRSGSPIAWLFDNGSQARHWRSGKRTGTMWGKTPPTHIFSRTVAEARRALTLKFRAILQRHGASSVIGE